MGKILGAYLFPHPPIIIPEKKEKEKRRRYKKQWKVLKP